MRLSERHRVTLTAFEAAPACRCPFDDFDAKLAFAQPIHRQQLARGDGNGPGFIRETDQFPLEFGETFDLGLGNQAVNWIGKFCSDGDSVGTLEGGADQKRRGDMRHVDGIVVQRVDHLVGTAGNRDDDFEIQTLVTEESLAVANGNRQRENTARS